jgi:hypothetical protein
MKDLRRGAPLIALIALVFSAFAAGPAGATVLHRNAWDVSLEGKQIVKWSFAAERPENCPAYYGTASEKAQGSGRIAMVFATKAPMWAETYVSGRKLKFMSFSTEGWSVPAIFNKRGKFSVQFGKPCGSEPGDPTPAPQNSDESGCGSTKTTLRPSLSWAEGKLQLIADLETLYLEACPGPFEQAMDVDANAPCTPDGKVDGVEGDRLQELDVPLSAGEFNAGEPFTATANHTYRCEFPSRWPGKPPLKLELTTKYELDFKPRP